ncbi:hypothetical protein Cri9333_1121 [Crinalium epipsammum PCC 9333]|uniref:Sortilin N-terminal domain-containing protein n=1 Tax=Crinalium epipsammum PCC 9333 TaxID=1173022 RepID=K9VY26_9CYAN|nr:putative baseplate assembly protein [Crinalium epipsammum]AFZ12030.1 hypothetical protein Cri9333_1121 [Crinalium epipsammum PCC 9333]
MSLGDSTPKKPENRPGLPKIAYRISDYAGFRRRLLNLLPSILRSSDKAGVLAKLTTRLNDDPAIALLDAWAVVGEVLTFYQERIANEGYLRTATERRSVLELARAIGYELKPGVAASTFLTFTVEDAPLSPRVATIPKGTQIMSIPSKDELPQIFETITEFTAHVDWNVIKPRPSRPQKITSNTRQLYLNGISTQLKAGDYLLLVDEDRETRTYVLPITDVKEDAQAGSTLVKWEQYLPINQPPKTPLHNPKVFAFRQKANLFGYNAPAWEDMSAEVKLAAIAEKGCSIQGGVFRYSDNNKQWNSASKGLPNADILCLVIQDGVLFAGTAGKGIFRSKDNGKSWEPVNNGLINLHIQTLYTNIENPPNPLFAGTPGGGVFRSKDGGETWVQINTGNVRVKHEEDKDKTQWRSVITSLPNTIVRSILTLDNYIFVGTDDGLYYSDNQGRDWLDTNLKDQAVYVLLNVKSKEKQDLIVGTDSGLYRYIKDDSTSGSLPKFADALKWHESNHILKERAILSLAKVKNDNNIFVGTDAGVFYFSVQETTWKDYGNPLLNDYTIRSLAIYKNGEYYIFAASEQGVFGSISRLNNTNIKWTNVSKNVRNSLSTPDITTLAFNKINDTNKDLFAGSKFTGFLKADVKNQNNKINTSTNHSKYQQEWLDFKLESKHIDLDTLYPQILPNSWIVLVDKNNYINQDNNQLTVAAHQVKSTSTITRKDFGLNAKITQIEPYKIVRNSQKIQLRSTVVFSRSEELELVEELLTVSERQQEIFKDPIQDETLLMNDFIQGLQSNQTLIVNGKRIGIQLDDVGGVFQGNYAKILIKDLEFKKINQGLMNSQVTALTHGSNKIIAGTTEGIFYSTHNGNYWQPIVGWSQVNQKLKIKDIQAILTFNQTDRRNLIFVGTAEGIFRSKNSGETWENIKQGLTYTDIRAIVFNSTSNTLFIATINGGVFQSKNNGENWTATSLRGTDVQALALNKDTNKMIAGTVQDGVFYSSNNGSTWQQFNDHGLTNRNITAVAIAQNNLFAGTSGSGVFRSKDNGANWEQININLTNLEIRCLTVDANENIWVGTASRGVFYSDNQGDLWQPVNANLTNIDVRAILIHNDDTVFVGGIGILQSVDGFDTKPVQRRDVLQLLELPAPVLNAPANYKQWKLMDKDGFQGYLTTISAEEITLLPAAADSEVVSEVVKIQSPPSDQQMPILTLQQPLKNAYDPTTVKIYGNVVEATHGEKIEEVLGSGDGNLTNQRFALKKPPLTYVSATTPSGANSTLQVQVNGILWQEVSSLYSLTAQNQSYIIRIEDDGKTTVTFGDGIKGSRLPTGEENITATYRSGIGLDGNIGVDRLSLLKTRPLGIIEVTNPIPATGAAAPESLEEARTKAPSTVRTLDRIVSLQDFEDFARSFAGIGKAQAIELWHEETQLVHITIASANGAEVLQESPLYTNLIAAINLARDQLQKVQVDSYDRLLFNLEARLILDSPYQAETIKEKVRAALNSTFTFERRQFAQAVTASEVVAIIQNIEGVIAVDLDALYQARSSKALEPFLMAKQARSDPQTDQVHPAQLLLLNPAGIKLTIVSAL